MTLLDFRAWCYDATLEELEMARDQRKGKYLAVIVCELKRREAYS